MPHRAACNVVRFARRNRYFAAEELLGTLVTLEVQARKGELPKQEYQERRERMLKQAAHLFEMDLPREA